MHKLNKICIYISFDINDDIQDAKNHLTIPGPDSALIANYTDFSGKRNKAANLGIWFWLVAHTLFKHK